MLLEPGMECWYRNGCNLYTENCYKTCHRYLEMHYLISNCGMKYASKYIKPIQPEKRDLKAFVRLQEIKDNVVSFVRNGDNLYIVSKNSGNGKTTWSLKILYKYFDEIWNGNGFRVRGYFIYVPDLLDKLKNQKYKETEEYKEIDDVIKKSDIVVWDDICSASTQADINILTRYIDYRCLNGKANIYNGNLLGNDLKEKLGDRLFNKIYQNSEVVEFKGQRC